ncbi:hypothetical protein HpEKA48_12750 [Helicobacter pylori]
MISSAFCSLSNKTFPTIASVAPPATLPNADPTIVPPTKPKAPKFFPDLAPLNAPNKDPANENLFELKEFKNYQKSGRLSCKIYRPS